MNKAPDRRGNFCYFIPTFLAVASIILGILFCHSSNKALVANDAPAHLFQNLHFALNQNFSALWSAENWLGQPYNLIPPDFNSLILKWVHYPFSVSLLTSLNLFLGGVGMLFLLRTLKLSPLASFFGGISFLLTNTLLTLTYPGHINKIMTCAWIPFSTAFFLMAVREKSFFYYIGSGAFLGLGLLGGEIQILYYLGFWYVFWAAFSLLELKGSQSLKPMAIHLGGGLTFIVVCSLIIGASTIQHSLHYLKENTPVSGAADTTQNWNFATQFYFPPEEILSYITTIQFFGGPHAYWGRDGNPTPLRLSDDYMGLLPLGFAILGAIACWRIWQVRLFVIMGVGSLIISFGREGGLYWLLYQLPTMKSQRNPHRWSFFVAFAVCVLATYGMDWLRQKLAEMRNEKLDVKKHPLGKSRRPVHLSTLSASLRPWNLTQNFLLSGVVLGSILFMIAGVLCIDPQSAAKLVYKADALLSPQGPLFIERTYMLLASLTRTGFFLALSSGSVYWIIQSSKFRVRSSKFWSFAPWGALFLILIFDLGTNAKRYIQFYDWKESYLKNPIATILRQDHDFYRVKAIGSQQNAVINNLVSAILPFHRIPVVDPPAISRMPSDYKILFDYLQNHYVKSERYYDFFNIKYVLSPTPFSDLNVKLIPVSQSNGIYIYMRPNFMPRAWLVTSANVLKDDSDTVLFQTMHPALNLRETAVLEEAPEKIPFQIPSSKFEITKAEGGRQKAELKRNQKPETRNAHPESSVRITYYENNSLALETSADIPTMLVLSEKWDPNWKAWLDGTPTKIYKTNFLMRGIELPSGKHTVRMEYRPSMFSFWISSFSVAAFFLWSFGFGLWKWRHGWVQHEAIE